MPVDTAGKNTQVVGNYELVVKIADGGMGSVYRARHRETGQTVAIKILSPHLASNQILRRRLEQEYNAARTFDHPNLVRALDFGYDDNLPYLVMEFVEGESLGQRIERDGRLSENEAIRIISQVAQGLLKAHNQGMIHRDVKPDNILITPDGQAKLTDLGLVKEVDADLNLTRTGRGLGTPHFMSPEQFRNAKKADVRCDIYSLGATLYMMVTGQLPFKSCGPVDAWMKKINNDLASPSDLVPNLTDRMDWAIRRAMSPDPQQRPASCREFLEDISGQITRKIGEEEPGDLWYVYFKDDEGVVHTVKGTLSGVRRNLKQGRLGGLEGVRASRYKTGPFDPLRTLPEFRDLVVEPPPPAEIAATPRPVRTSVTTPVNDTGITTLINAPVKTMPHKAKVDKPSVTVLPPLVDAHEDSQKFLVLFVVALATGILGYFLVPVMNHLRWF